MKAVAPSRQRAPGTLDLLEEAVYCLRRAPWAHFAIYYLGSIPFVLGLFYFWTDMSYNAGATQRCLGASLGLAGLFVWMKSWQAVWASQLRAHLRGQPPAGWTLRRSVRLILTQTCCQPWWFLAMPVAGLLLLPVAWAHAFFQNLTVLGDGTEPSITAVCRRASQQALLWHRQNVLLLLHIGLLGLVVLANVGISLGMLPYLLKMFLGIESVFTRHSGALGNSTFLAVIVGLATLILGPLSKTLYVLRCFYGESLQSGEDLQATLGRLLHAKTLAIWCIALSCSASFARGMEPATTVPPQRVEQLDHSLDTVLQQREYVWRLPRLHSPTTEASNNFFTAIGETLGAWFQTLDGWIEKLLEWLRHLTPEAERTPQQFSTPMASLLLWGILLCVLLLCLAVLWYLRRQRHLQAAIPTSLTVTTSLDEETLLADALPAQGWWAMAQELVQRGERRLATRAFYLASLAYLAQHNLVTLAAHKSSRDYQRELRRRAHDRPGLLSAFGQHAATFERVWYGHYEPPDDLARQFTLTHERIQASAQN